MMEEEEATAATKSYTTTRRDSGMEPMTSAYNEFNQSQSTAWKYAQPLFEEAMNDLRLRRGQSNKIDHQVFRVADFGCATGGNSLAPLKFVSEKLFEEEEKFNEESSPSSYLHVVLVDLPSNDWKTVATTVTPECIISTNHSTLFVHMVGQTFYNVCAPPGTLDLSFSLVAVHWMKSYPCDIPGGLCATDPIQNTDPEQLQAWKVAGAQDFMEFTNARYQELKVGGKFIGVIACPKQSGNGDCPWSKVGWLLYQKMLAISSTQEENESISSCVFPICYRTSDDVRSGLSNDKWEIKTLEFHETKDPIREKLERQEITPEEYAKIVIDAFKSVCHQTCLGGLTKLNKISTSQAEHLLEESYQACLGTISKDPEQYNLDVAFWYVLATKKQIGSME